MKILVVSSYYQPAVVYGGPVSALANFNKILAAKGHNVRVFTTAANGRRDFPELSGRTVLVDGIPVTYFPRWWFGQERKPFGLFFSPAMGRALRKLRYYDFDLILISSVWADPGRLAASTARKLGIPYVCYTFGCFEPWAFRRRYIKKKLYFSFIEKTILNYASGIVVSNMTEIKTLSSLGIKSVIRCIPLEKGTNIPEVNIDELKNCLSIINQDLSKKPFILFLSRLHPKKGLDLLLPAFAAIKDEFPEWRLVVAGPDEGGYRQVLEKLAADLGLNSRICFPGLVTGELKAALLANAGLFVLPSYSEGFPVVVSEALGYGLPIVLTTTCYVPEVAREGAGLEIPPAKEALIAALRQLLGHEDFRRACAAQAREVARRHFTWEAVAEQSLAFYREVMS